MSGASATGFELAFDLSIYTEGAVKQAVQALSSVAAFELDCSSSRALVRAQDLDPRLVRRVRGELMNFALGLSVGGSR